MMDPKTVVVCDKAAVPLKVALIAGGRIKVPEPVNAVEAPLTVTVPLKATLELKPSVTMLVPQIHCRATDG